MKLVEMKCPNCGANLEFNKSDEACKCEYCHRKFQIERNKEDDESVTLEPVKSVISSTLLGIVIIIFIVAFALFFTILFRHFINL